MTTHSIPTGKLTLELAVHRIPDQLPISCPLCEVVVDVHQPDHTSPDRLLATCLHCKTWFLIDDSGTSMIQLPS